jgi:hypothetical protein
VTRNKGKYPNTYGDVVQGTHYNMLTPLTVDDRGDELVPPNDMHAVAGSVGDKDYISPDPLGVVSFGDGTKSK